VIEQGPFLDLAVDPIALAQQNGRRGVAQAIQIIVRVLEVATSSAVFVVAIGAFVALTLHKFGRVSRSSDHQPGPHETAMYLIHEPISVEDGNTIVAELNPAIDVERYRGNLMPVGRRRGAPTRTSQTSVAASWGDWFGRRSDVRF
jgi:hypothetical protein